MPETKPILFCVVTWMEYYDGTPGDKPSGGGAFIDREGYGYEMFNFKPFRGQFYGWAQVGGTIAIERLGADKGADSVSGVTVVFVTPLHGNTPYVICGWYNDATVYRTPQYAPLGARRRHQGEDLPYNLRCSSSKESSHLLTIDARAFPVQRGRGWLGQSRIWYADGANRQKFVDSVRDYIRSQKLPINIRERSSRHGGRWQSDVKQRQLIEQRAIETVWSHFEDLGFEMTSVERLNLGWDLEATKSRLQLKLEVKGTSGTQVACEVTANEYAPLKRKDPSYRLCVVTEALRERPVLRPFRWSQERMKWCSENETLSIKELTGARLFL